MKVLHIFNSLMPSGAETMWRNAALLLKKEGVTTHVVATSQCIGPYAEEMVTAGFKVFHVPHINRCLFDFSYCIRLYKHLRINKYDVVQIHPEGWRLTNVIVCRLAGVKKITTTIHSNFEVKGMRFWQRVLRMKMIERLGAIVVAISDSVLQNENRYRYKPMLIYNWIDLNRFKSLGARMEVRKELCFKENEKVLMMVGNCSEIKNHAFFFRVLSKLPSEYMAVHIGNEVEEQTGERALVKELGLDGKVRFLGMRKDVSRLLEGCDMFVMCSLLEGLALSCLEALSKRLPAVVTDVPGLRDLADHIPLCVRVKQDEKEFAGKILEVVNWPKVELGSRQRKSEKIIDELFSMEKNVRKYIGMWKSV